MPDTPITVILLGVIAVSVLIMTGAMLVAVWDLRKTLWRVNAMLPSADQAIREAHRSLQQMRHLLTTTNHVTRHIETVIREVCDAASDTLERLVLLKGRAQDFWRARFGNGARAEPRQHHRRR